MRCRLRVSLRTQGRLITIDVSLVRLVILQGLYLSRLVLPSVVDKRNRVDIIENFHLALNNFRFFRITVAQVPNSKRYNIFPV